MVARAISFDGDGTGSSNRQKQSERIQKIVQVINKYLAAYKIRHLVEIMGSICSYVSHSDESTYFIGHRFYELVLIHLNCCDDKSVDLRSSSFVMVEMENVKPLPSASSTLVIPLVDITVSIAKVSKHHVCVTTEYKFTEILPEVLSMK